MLCCLPVPYFHFYTFRLNWQLYNTTSKITNNPESTEILCGNRSHFPIKVSVISFVLHFLKLKQISYWLYKMDKIREGLPLNGG